MKIPRGVQQVSWKTSEGTQIKYRVRINRKTFKADRLFDDLKEATEFLYLSKSKDGRIALTEHSEKEQMAKEAMMFYIQNPPIEHYIREYFKRYLKKDDTDTKKRSTNTYRQMINKIINVELKIKLDSKTGFSAFVDGMSKTKVVKFGDIKPLDLNEKIATDYIIERLKTVSKATVKREVSLLQSFFNKIRFIDNDLYKKLSSNPFENADKSLLNNSWVKRYRRLTDSEENELFKTLSTFKNQEMIQIVALALTTGMRRGEILELEWCDIKDDYIHLRDSKTGQRRVILSNESRDVLSTVKKIDERLFHYTADGFATNWQKIKIRSGIKDFRFHDLRREFISRLIERISNPVYLAEITGLSSINHIQSSYVEPYEYEKAIKNGISNEKDLMKSVGHSDIRMTSKYFTKK